MCEGGDLTTHRSRTLGAGALEAPWAEVEGRIERALVGAVEAATAPRCPEALCAAVNAAVFARGKRLRPRLCVYVALECGDPDPSSVDATATALELIHCASLAHDDLPCFDDADLRRDAPSIHRAYGVPIAVLVGDALVVQAFEVLARRAKAVPEKMAAVTLEITRAVGLPTGIIAGQASELESSPQLARYHRAKTASLFTAAASAGAAAADAEPQRWGPVGEHFGCAYQLIDDLRDYPDDSRAPGATARKDARERRLNAVRALGRQRAVERCRSEIELAIHAIPDYAKRGRLSGWIASTIEGLLAAIAPGEGNKSTVPG